MTTMFTGALAGTEVSVQRQMGVWDVGSCSLRSSKDLGPFSLLHSCRMPSLVCRGESGLCPQEGKEEVKPSESVHGHLISLLYLEGSHGLTPAVPSKIPQSADEHGTQGLLLKGKRRKEMG